MSGFEYRRPRSAAEAIELLGDEGAVALAGGTDLMVGIRHHTVDPATVVDLKSVQDIARDLSVREGRLSIGGRAVMSHLTASAIIDERFPALASAAAVVGSVQIRNRATLAGNLCNASPAADTAPVLLAYSAAVTIVGVDGTRTLPLEDFFLGPGKTALARGEVVASIEVPLPEPGTGAAFARVTRRLGVDLASVNLACVVAPTGRARFGFGAVGPTPVAAEATIGELDDDDGLERLLAGTSPITDVRAGADYRRAMLRVHTRRAMQAAVAGARW